MKHELKLNNGAVDAMNVSSLGVIDYLVVHGNGNMQTTRNDLLLSGFAILQISNQYVVLNLSLLMLKVSISENFSTGTEYNRNKLYMLYRKAKSIDQYKQKVFLSGDMLILDGKRYSLLMILESYLLI